MATELFVIHSDPWINLHHFLYQWARSAAERRPGDRRLDVEVPERGELDGLNQSERRAWTAALDHYREHLVARDLLWDRGMVVLRDPLGAIACSEGGVEAVDEALREVLTAAMAVYRRHWWPEHDRVNRAWIEEILPVLEPFESPMGERLDQLYRGRGWPPEGLRVDVAAYANHTAAYTTNRPDQVTLTSTHRLHRGLNGVEVLFHEASHAAGFEQPILEQLDDSFGSLGARPPRDLSHVIQFITPAEVLRSLLSGEARAGFQPYAERLGLYRHNPTWERYRQVVERHWLPFLRGEVARTHALAGIAGELAAP